MLWRLPESEGCGLTSDPTPQSFSLRQPHQLHRVLDELRPRYVVMYDPDVRSVRQLEVSGVTCIHGNHRDFPTGVPVQSPGNESESVLPSV